MHQVSVSRKTNCPNKPVYMSREGTFQLKSHCINSNLSCLCWMYSIELPLNDECKAQHSSKYTKVFKFTTRITLLSAMVSMLASRYWDRFLDYEFFIFIIHIHYPSTNLGLAYLGIIQKCLVLWWLRNAMVYKLESSENLF